MAKKDEIKGAYIERMKLAEDISRKIKEGIPLMSEEIAYVCRVLRDPLDEFCLREGTYRLVEMHDLSAEEANSLENEAAEVVRDVIDYTERLYDDIDHALEDMIWEKTTGKTDA